MSNAPFGFEKPEDSPGFLLWQATMTWQRLIKKALEPFEISHAQFVVMALLMWFEKQGYDTTQIEIAQWSKLDKMTVSKSLKKLAAEGLLSRAEHTRDTRAKSVTLTAKGKTFIRKLVPLVEQVDEQFFSTVAAREQQTFMQVLARLIGDSHGE